MKLELLGDTHLGKPFKNGVPLTRRGDREKMQWAEFEVSLNVTCDYHVQMGDLFDAPIVPYSVVFRAARLYRKAALANPTTIYVVLRGNHDANRDTEKVTAFMLFTEMVRGVDNILVVDEDAVEFAPGHVAIPWHPVHNAREMIERSKKLLRGACVYGHWDVDGRMEGGSNYLPADDLKFYSVIKAFTGHDHKQRHMEINDLPVFVTGSMQPFSHAEDDSEQFYVTRTLAEVLCDVDAYKNKHLRIRLQGDEVLDTPIDCLQLTLVREGRDDEAVEVNVDFETFDLEALLGQAAVETGLRPDLLKTVTEKLQEGRMNDGQA